MADVFISYKQDERSAIEQIAMRLRALRLTVWFDASMSAGEAFNDEIDREARAAKAVLVCWSSAARASRWVKAEAMIGFEHDKLAACYVAGPEGFSPPAPFNTTHTEDLRSWLASPSDYHPAWRSVLRRVSRLAEREDIATWCALDEQATSQELRAWIAEHSASPLFMAAHAQLQVREQEDDERERLAEVARARRASEEAERRAAAEAERRAREADRSAREEMLIHERIREAERLTSEASARERRRHKDERLARRALGAIGLIAVTGMIVWALLQLPTPAARAEAAARRVEHQAFTEAYWGLEQREFRVARGETLAGLLSRAGASPAETNAALASITAVYNTGRLRPGQQVNLFFDRRGGDARLTGVAFRSAPGASVTANRTASGGFVARQVEMLITFENARISAQVETSLYETALRLGATDREVAAFADALAPEVDVRRDVRPGHEFELVFERYFDDEGNTVRTGDLLFAAAQTEGFSRAVYAFMAPGDTRLRWYDAQARGAHLDTPDLSGEGLQLFMIERARIDTLRRVRSVQTSAGDVASRH